jgi:hypothetical protein
MSAGSGLERFMLLKTVMRTCVRWSCCSCSVVLVLRTVAEPRVNCQHRYAPPTARIDPVLQRVSRIASEHPRSALSTQGSSTALRFGPA